MLVRQSARISNPKTTKLVFNFSFSSQSSPESPPRKGRQAARRILKLLSLKPHHSPNFVETLKTLETSPQSLSSSQASNLITAISNPLISFDFYRFLKSLKPLFQPDSVIYASLIKSQLQSINPKLFKIEFYFSEMKKHKVCLLPDDLHSLFEFVVPDSVEVAEFLVREVLEKNEYDVGSYNYLITVYTRNGMCKDAILIAERAKARFENLSLRFYACVMNVYMVNGDTRAAMNLLLEMEDRGIVADEGIYGVLLGILCRGGSVRLCMAILEEMTRLGYRPDEFFAMDLLKMFMKEGMVSEIEYLFREGILKCKESLSAFVETMADKRTPLEGLQVVKNLRESGLNVDGHVYASLIHCCGSMGLIEEAEKVFDYLRSREDAEHKESVYSSMIYAYSKKHMRRKADGVE